MSTLSLRLPDSLHEKVKELAERDDISINQFIATAVAEKMSALLTLDYLAERAKRSDRAAFARVLAKVPSRAPLPGDEWPALESAEPHQASQPTGRQRRGNRGSPRPKAERGRRTPR
jgi:hypothetical protein